jgi:predicted enzyme related to lactoylglutathione lyase
MFDTGHGQQGGIMTRMPQTPMSFWLYYFDVSGLDAAVERINARGGHVINGPHEVPGGQWVVQATDPHGAMFALVAPGR